MLNQTNDTEFFDSESFEQYDMATDQFQTPKSPASEITEFQPEAEYMDMSRPKTQGAYADTLRVLTQLIRELQLDTRQKHEILNQMFDDNVNIGGAYQPMAQPISQPIAQPIAQTVAQPRARSVAQQQVQPLQRKPAQPMVGGAQNQNLVSRKPYLDHLKKIPEFDGESYKALRNFLDIAGALNESWTNDVERNDFIDTLSLQLRGEARDVVGNLYQSSFDEMRDKLLKYFLYLINKEVVTSQLENIRQNDKETMSEYAERARTANMTERHAELLPGASLSQVFATV